MNKNEYVMPQSVIRSGEDLLFRTAGRVKGAFVVDPKRASIVSVSFVIALVLIGTGLFGSSDSGNQNNQGRRSIAEIASDFFTGDDSRTVTSGPTATPGSSQVRDDQNATVPTDLPGQGTVPGTVANTGAPSTTNPGQGAAPVNTAPTEIVTPQGLRLVVGASEASPATGQDITFRANIVDGNGALLGLRWSFGDGNTANSDPRACSDSSNRLTVEEGRTDFATSASHSYRNPGDYTVRVTARTGTRCGARADNDDVTWEGRIVVTGNPINNGPSAPTAMATVISGGTSADSRLGIRIKAADTDGYLSQIVVQWNTETAPEVISFPLSQCNDPGIDLPSSSRDITPDHAFERGGVYDVTVTVMSTGCDGSQSQQAITVLNGITVGNPVEPAQIIDDLLE